MAGLNGFPGFIKDIVHGTTRDFVIEITRDLKDTNGNVIGEEPVDLTGSKFVVTFDYDKNITTSPVLEIIIDPPSDPLNGKTIGKITSDQTATLETKSIYYSIRWITASGDTYPIDMGKIKILPAISNVRS